MTLTTTRFHDTSLPSDYIEPLLTIYFAFFIFKIYRRARYNLEPIHLFSLNILLDFATQVVVEMMAMFIIMHDDDDTKTRQE